MFDLMRCGDDPPENGKGDGGLPSSIAQVHLQGSRSKKPLEQGIYSGELRKTQIDLVPPGWRCEAEIHAEFCEATAPLTGAQVRWLLAQGVPVEALAHDPNFLAMALATAQVVFDEHAPSFNWREPGDDDGEGAICILARNRFGEVADVVAWSPRSGHVATHYGRLSVLGGQHVFGPRLSGPLVVHATPLEWLRAGRRGVVVIEPSRARDALEGQSLEVADPDFGQALADKLRHPEPQIFLKAA